MSISRYRRAPKPMIFALISLMALNAKKKYVRSSKVWEDCQLKNVEKGESWENT